ncbi:RDD family protein [Alteromonas sp. 14N.309.X.WAT.G.H12]|uniref:RDD family protein n=1 Tax=Alteromonas sp. 14N.309.X.WAT.G.H12 TaxID=3120824 RepID=UPI002FD0DDB5
MNAPVSATLADEMKYTGFWPRVGASLIDTVLICIITWPILVSVYGWRYFESEAIVAGFTDFLMSWVFPLIAIITFWVYRQATPGKILINAQIVDAKTGQKPTLQQYIVRYIGYFIALLPLGLGILWVAWDKKKQGWHDKLASTVVISPKGKHTEDVSFER